MLKSQWPLVVRLAGSSDAGLDGGNPAEQRGAADWEQCPLLRRSRCSQRLTPSVRPCGRKTNPQDTEGGTPRSPPGPSKPGEPPRQEHPKPGEPPSQEHPKTGASQARSIPRQPTSKTGCTGRPLPHRAGLARRPWGPGGPGRGRLPSRGLTNACRRRATAGIFWQAWGCPLWPAPEARR